MKQPSRTSFRRRSAHPFLLPAALLLLAAHPCAAQSSQGTDLNHTSVATLIPQATHSAPPAWVKPGLRLTYAIGVASARGSGQDWQMDDHNHLIGWDKIGIGGNGFVQTDVVAMDGGQVAMVQSNDLISPQEPLLLLARDGIVAPQGTGVDMWVNPALLGRLQNGMHGAIHVYRAPYKIGETTRQGVWMHERSRSGTLVYIYDRETGVMLHFASEGMHRPTGFVGPNELENTTNKLLLHTTLVDQRMLKLPWVSQSISTWTANPSQLHYQGSQTTGSGNGVGIPIREPVSQSTSLQAHGTNWASFVANLQFPKFRPNRRMRFAVRAEIARRYAP